MLSQILSTQWNKPQFCASSDPTALQRWELWQPAAGSWRNGFGCVSPRVNEIPWKYQGKKIQVENMLFLYHKRGCKNILKGARSPFPLGSSSPETCGMVSDGHGQRFHQDTTTLEKRYQDKWSTSILVDCCWTLARDEPEQLYKLRQRNIEHRSGHSRVRFRL